MDTSIPITIAAVFELRCMGSVHIHVSHECESEAGITFIELIGIKTTDSKANPVANFLNSVPGINLSMDELHTRILLHLSPFLSHRTIHFHVEVTVRVVSA